MSSEGEVIYRFLDGNNNEASVTSFLCDMVGELDRYRPDWRKDYVLKLDNCASHKTLFTRQAIERLEIPTIFSAPASFLVAPVEGVFGAIKAINFNSVSEPEIEEFKDKGIKKLTNKQSIMSKISNYLN